MGYYLICTRFIPYKCVWLISGCSQLQSSMRPYSCLLVILLTQASTYGYSGIQEAGITISYYWQAVLHVSRSRSMIMFLPHPGVTLHIPPMHGPSFYLYWRTKIPPHTQGRHFGELSLLDLLQEVAVYSCGCVWYGQWYFPMQFHITP